MNKRLAINKFNGAIDEVNKFIKSSIDYAETKPALEMKKYIMAQKNGTKVMAKKVRIKKNHIKDFEEGLKELLESLEKMAKIDEIIIDIFGNESKPTVTSRFYITKYQAAYMKAFVEFNKNKTREKDERINFEAHFPDFRHWFYGECSLYLVEEFETEVIEYLGANPLFFGGKGSGGKTPIMPQVTVHNVSIEPMFLNKTVKSYGKYIPTAIVDAYVNRINFEIKTQKLPDSLVSHIQVSNEIYKQNKVETILNKMQMSDETLVEL